MADGSNVTLDPPVDSVCAMDSVITKFPALAVSVAPLIDTGFAIANDARMGERRTGCVDRRVNLIDAPWPTRERSIGKVIAQRDDPRPARDLTPVVTGTRPLLVAATATLTPGSPAPEANRLSREAMPTMVSRRAAQMAPLDALDATLAKRIAGLEGVRDRTATRVPATLLIGFRFLSIPPSRHVRGPARGRLPHRHIAASTQRAASRSERVKGFTLR